ncbi:hypothetical protein DPMN_058633 [Dreissena polymorpha]|uniref:Uncharacterized protein n=1 Tax=Dreissena polymorpha TaxID=45954 RepID=A0A9D4C239_DREPO|nr:hypothetical protein DPMN_058633 [Dreissena polymorpha]
MPDSNSPSDSKHSSGSESEDHKSIVVSEKSRGDSPTVSSTVTASHQDPSWSPLSQRTPYHHQSAAAAPVGFSFRYTTCADVNMSMYPHAQRAGGSDVRGGRKIALYVREMGAQHPLLSVAALPGPGQS